MALDRLVDLPKAPQRPITFRRTLVNTNQIKEEILQWLHPYIDGCVQSGPFEGMKLLTETSWCETHLSPLLLGSYEEELHQALEWQIKRLKDLKGVRIAVIGCAEGYYAVGLKRRLPDAKVFAVDIDQKAIDICNKTAAANGVEVITGARMVDVLYHPDLMVVDCEGSELIYLDIDKHPHLMGAHMIVEVHNLRGTETMPAVYTDQVLYERFSTSHHINMIVSGSRDPGKFAHLLGDLNDDYRFLAMSEGRPTIMSWMVMRPRGVALS